MIATPEEFCGISHILESQAISGDVRRLGGMAKTSKLCILLRSHFRHPKCFAFLWKFFLRLIKSYRICRELRIDGFIKLQEDVELFVEVYGDGSFTTSQEERDEELKVYKSIKDQTFNEDIEKRKETGIYVLASSYNNDLLYEKYGLSSTSSLITELWTTKKEAPAV